MHSGDYLVEPDRGVVGQPARELPILASVDVVVAGGGPSGIAAAVTAARLGARTLLLEAGGFLGGVATGTMMGAFVITDRARGFAREMLDRLIEAGAAPRWEPGLGGRTNTTPFDIESMKTVSLSMVAEAGVQLLFYTSAVDAILEGKSVQGIVVESKAGRQAILAKVVIDCTADADLARRAGAPVLKGREADAAMRPISLLFRLGRVDLDKTLAYARAHPEDVQYKHRDGIVMEAGGERVLSRVSGFYSLVDQAKTRGELAPEIHYFRFENGWMDRGIVLVNAARVYGLDGLDPWDLTRAQLEGHRQVAQLVAFAKKYMPGCERAYLLDTSVRIGVRETRRIQADYYLTEEDSYEQKSFADRVLRLDLSVPERPGSVPWDVHSPDPIEGSPADLQERDPDVVPQRHLTTALPYRSLLPQNVEGMLVAGRAIGVSHQLDGLTRNMIIAMMTGHVAGSGAGLAVTHETDPRHINIGTLQQRLIADGLDIGSAN